MRYLSVCSGMEAASVAWHTLGWKPVGFCEIEPFPCAILKHRFPDTPNYGSLTDYAQWPIERGAADLLVGGTPCQSFSVAGLRKGLEDPRGNLALVFLGLADKLKPRWIVWENVPGVLSSNGGRDFGSFLGALVQLGYGFAYRVLDAQHFGVPQRRRRVFVVACLGDWHAPAEVLLEPDCVRRDPKKGRAKGQGAAAGAEGGVGADHTVRTLCARDYKGADNIYVEEGKAVLHPCPDHDRVGSSEPIAFSSKDYGGDATVGISPTLRSQNSVEGNQNSSWSIAITQPKPVVIDRAAFNQGQNAQYEPHIGESEVMDSLVARGPHAVGQPLPFRKSKRASSTTDNETWVEADASNTLNNFDLGDTRTTHAVVGPHVCYPLKDPNDIACAEHRRQNGIGNDGDPAFTLRTAVTPGVATPMAVRRLTPVECERLQGFPDNWSRIPWKGKPKEECPDGPRYKACGNSMAVPVMRWIGERIAAVEARNISRP